MRQPRERDRGTEGLEETRRDGLGNGVGAGSGVRKHSGAVWGTGQKRTGNRTRHSETVFWS